MPVATSWSAAARMSLSVTFSAKKFQLFQPMGGVCATTCCGARDAFVGADVCDAAVREVRTKTAEESKATMRMVAFLNTISEKLYAVYTRISKRRLAAGMFTNARALWRKPESPGTERKNAYALAARVGL